MKISAPRSQIVRQDGHTARAWVPFFSDIGSLLTALSSSGTTADRPVNFLFVGRTYFDTTIGRPIWYTGTGWIDAQGNPV